MIHDVCHTGSTTGTVCTGVEQERAGVLQETVTDELVRHGLAESTLGVLLIDLSGRMERCPSDATSYPSLVRQFRQLYSDVLDKAPPAVEDPVDELDRRRQRKVSDAGG